MWGARLFDLVASRRALVAFAVLVVLVAGAACALLLPEGIYPELEFPRLVAVATGEGNPPEQVEASIARPLESELGTLPGLVRMRTRVQRGTCETQLQFEDGTDMTRAEQLARAAIAQARESLPDGTDVELERVSASDFPILSFDLVGGSGIERREIAETVVHPALSRVAGIGRVGLIGGDVRELTVLGDPERLAAAGLRPSDLASAVQAALVRQAAGRTERDRETQIVTVETVGPEASELAGLLLRSPAGALVPLADVARIEERPRDRLQAVHGPEGDAVQVDVTRRPGAAAPDVIAGARAVVKSLRLPEGMRMVEIYDQGALIRDSVFGIRDAILIGILLTVATLGLFLREARPGLIAASSVPFALLSSFLGLKLLGQTLNLMTLGGMAIAIGIVIDDSVVIVETAVRRREAGAAARDAARGALEEMAGPVLGTTITTVVVLLPLAFFSGVAGSFLRALSVSLACAVVASLLYALLAVPLLCERLRSESERRRPAWRRFAARHARLVRRVVARPPVAWIAVLALVVTGAACVKLLHFGFLPEMDEGAFVVDYFLPAGSSLQETERAALAIERAIAGAPGVKSWSRRTAAELGPLTATPTNTGDVVVRLASRKSRPEAEEIIADVRDRIAAAVPAARVEFVQILEDVVNDLSGSARPIEVRVLGPDRATLASLGGEVASRLEGVEGLEDLDTGMEKPVQVAVHRVDAAAAARAGLAPNDVAGDLEVALAGQVVGSAARGDRLVPVRVRLDVPPAAVEAAPIATPSGLTTLGALAPRTERLAASVLTREGGSPAIVASADVEDRDAGAVAQDVSAKLKDVEAPPGHRIEVGGRVETRRRAFLQLAAIAGAGLACVTAVLLAQLRSVGATLVVLVSVPTALVGSIATLAATGVALDVSSLMGLVLLVGLVVKNGILLLHEAMVQEDGGLPPRVALVVAGRRRLRPILMTTLCTVFGLLPLALALGAGSELQRPLALAVIGGLVTSTLATLLLMPALAVRRRRGVMDRHSRPHRTR